MILREIHKLYNDTFVYLLIEKYEKILSTYLIAFYLTFSASDFLLTAWLNY